MTTDRKAYMKAYNQRPEVKAYKKAYNQRPEVKAYMKAYYQRPEVKAYMKAYYQRPEVKAYKKAYNQRPEVKAYKKAYNQRPDLINFYTKEKIKCEALLKPYGIPPVALQGKLVMLNELIDNLVIIDKHVSTLDKSIRQRTREKMIDQLLYKEGILVSKRKAIGSPHPREQDVPDAHREQGPAREPQASFKEGA